VYANGSNRDGAGTYCRSERKIAKRITDTLAEEAGARREGIVVAFHEVSKESYASAGELMVDKGK
jgi:phenylpyruvate tautomerase PptA (4-oxalocrotonate tautomerase family)